MSTIPVAAIVGDDVCANAGPRVWRANGGFLSGRGLFLRNLLPTNPTACECDFEVAQTDYAMRGFGKVVIPVAFWP